MGTPGPVSEPHTVYAVSPSRLRSSVCALIIFVFLLPKHPFSLESASSLRSSTAFLFSMSHPRMTAGARGSRDVVETKPELKQGWGGGEAGSHCGP